MNEIYIGNDPGSPPETICDNANVNCVRKLEAMLDGAANTVLGCAIQQKQSAPGNAAAMREALLYARNTLVLYSRDMKPRYQAEVGFMIDKCDAALSAPARNCDIYPTAEEAYAAWQKLPNLVSAFAWLYAPAEGGDHA